MGGRLEQVRATAFMLIAVTAAGGCASLRSRPKPVASRVLPSNATCEQVVAELNRNVLGDGVRPGLVSWRSDHARVSVTGMPGSVAATIAVDAPRRLRIQVSSPMGGKAMDLGSNGEEFWLWSKDVDANALLVGRHDGEVRPHLADAMPFEPDWLLDVMGVVPTAADDVRLVRHGESVELVADHQTPSGQRLEKVKRVSLITGEILGHELREASGRTVARADVKRQYRCPGTGLLLPEEVRIVWPDFERELRIRIGRHQINPPHIADAMFTRPERAAWTVVELTRPTAAPAIQQTVAVPSAVMHDGGRSAWDPSPAQTLPVKTETPAAVQSVRVSTNPFE